MVWCAVVFIPYPTPRRRCATRCAQSRRPFALSAVRSLQHRRSPSRPRQAKRTATASRRWTRSVVQHRDYMETHVDGGSPLSNYLEGMFPPAHGCLAPLPRSVPSRLLKMEGSCYHEVLTMAETAAGEREEAWDWREPDNREHDISPPLTPPRDFAPRGLAKVRRKFRDRLAKPMQLDLPSLPFHNDSDYDPSPILDVLRLVLETVTSSIDHARSIGFLERLRLAIIQSQLLDNPLTLGYQSLTEPTLSQPAAELNFHGPTVSGVVAAAVFGFCLASLARWYSLGGFLPTWKRLLVSVALTVALLHIVRAYIRREILRNIQRQGLVESASFFALSRDFDCANSAALNFIMEVELVARGYRL